MNYSEMKYEEINDEIEKLLDIDNNKLDSEATRGQRIFTEINRIYIQVSRRLMSLTDQKNSVELHKFKHFTGKLTSAHYKENPLDVALLKTDVPRYMDTDAVVVEIRNLVKEAEMIVKLVESSLATLKGRSYDIRNAIDFQKFISGN
jgi:tRNA(Met) C34 N-acetyltransferase TmcA